MRIFITGAAGFIGFHLAGRLLAEGHSIVGLDGLTPYYDVTLKRGRLGLLRQSANFSFVEAMLEDDAALRAALLGSRPDVVIHLAAQAGVRYSLDNPRSYIEANIVGTFNLLEALRAQPTAHFMFASTSSVYGGNALPFTETDRTDHPSSLYAATKKSGEAMAHSYAHLFDLPTTILRFFTVYGPWGRPDMALFKFTEGILKGQPIDVYNHGRMVRDFTYVDDVVESIVRLIPLIPKRDAPASEVDPSLSPGAPYRIVNIAGGTAVALEAYIEAIEAATGRKAIRNNMPMQMGDVTATQASTRILTGLIGFRPATPIAIGVQRFVDWYRDYYQC